MEQKVDIVLRSEWGAAAPLQRERLTGSAQRVIIHHTAFESCHSLTECNNQLVRIQTMHMMKRGFDDIGYNFLVTGDGTVFEGRGWGVAGAHTKGNNHDSLGIAFMGNFNRDTPSHFVSQAAAALGGSPGLFTLRLCFVRTQRSWTHRMSRRETLLCATTTEQD